MFILDFQLFILKMLNVANIGTNVGICKNIYKINNKTAYLKLHKASQTLSCQALAFRACITF